MRFMCCLLAILFLVTPHSVLSVKDKVVICYYGTWASYRTGLGKFEVSNIPSDLCTHLVYTFVGIDNFGNVISLDPYLDFSENWGKGYLTKINALKKTSPHLKTILAVGGYNEGSQKYSLMASNPNYRKNFITSSINMVTKYGFDGLEVDWEYPNRGNSVFGQEDINNFSQLLRELREELDKRGLLLTGAVASVEQFAKLSYNVTAVSTYMDFVSIMAYDMYGAWDPVTGHNAPLHKAEADDAMPETLYSVDLALQYWLKQGCPPEKLVLGVPLYGRTFRLSQGETHVGAPCAGAGLAGPYTQTRGLIGYNELCYKFQTEAWSIHRDDSAMVPYAVKDKDWVSYDDPTSLVAKVEYSLQYDIAGVMVWSIETDDFHGVCKGGDFPLLRSVNMALGRTA